MLVVSLDGADSVSLQFCKIGPSNSNDHNTVMKKLFGITCNYLLLWNMAFQEILEYEAKYG